MNATWIPVGSAVGIILLSLVVLEVMSERVRVDRSSTAAWTFREAPAHSGPAFPDSPDDLLPLELELAGTGGREIGSGER